jgi:hypothetical protein
VDFPGPIGYPSPIMVVSVLRSLATRRGLAGCALAAAALIAAPMARSAQDFKFGQPSPDDLAEQASEQARQQKIWEQLGTRCRERLKEKKIMVVIGEQRSDGVVVAQQQNYGPHFQAINSRLRALGLRTYTPEEIRRQIAQAEIDAYFRNDPDRALSASKRLGASFVLRGLISAQATVNPVMPVNQVAVQMGFTLTDAGGRLVSEARASAASYAGSDVAAMALTLVNEKADEVVAQLYSDYCSNAGLLKPPAMKP